MNDIKTEERMVDVLKGMNTVQTTKFVALVAKTGIPQSTLSDRLKIMVDTGIVKRCWKGTYELTDAGRALLRQYEGEPTPEEGGEETAPAPVEVRGDDEGEAINLALAPQDFAIIRRFKGADGMEYYEGVTNYNGIAKVFVIRAIDTARIGIHRTETPTA